MKINKPVSQPNQHLMPKKPTVREGEQPVSGEDVKKDRLNNMAFAANQQLFIGAKSLMAALNKQLNVEGSLNFSQSQSKTLNITTEQSSILDKIDVEPISFDFEAVAKNVMEFVSGVIKGAKESGASDDKLNEMFEQARAGVDKGFEQAREELGQMDMLNKDIEQGMDKSYALIQDGIINLHNELFNPQQNFDLESQSLMMSEQEQGTIEINTLEGDKISINFQSNASLRHAQSQGEDQIKTEVSLSNNHSFSFEVQGNLNKDELKAVSALVKDISKLADDFFSGDFEKAWQQANKLDFDQAQIAQYALDFQEVKQVAIKQNYLSENSTSPIAMLSPYMKDLNKVMNQGQELFSGDNLKQMMQDVAQQQLNIVDTIADKSSAAFTDFNQQLLRALAA